MSVAGKRLLLVVPSATSFFAFLVEVATDWRRRGGAVAVAAGPCLPDQASGPDGPGPWPEGVEPLPLPEIRCGSPPAMIRAAGRLSGHVRAWRPDIVHAHFAAAVFLAAVVRRRAGHPPPCWMGTFHGLHGPVDDWRRPGVVAAVERWSARRMTEVCVLNAEDRTALAPGIGGVPIHVHGSCGVGCDLGRFDAGRFSAAERRRIRRDAGLSADTFVMAFVGRQTAFKGFDVAFRGYRLLRESAVDASLLIVGATDRLHGSGLSAEEWRLLERDPRVVRTGWRQDVSPWLSIADCCVLPSVREGMPVSLMEGLAMGVPAITVDSRGCRDVVRDGVDGFVLPSRSPEAIASAAAALAADPRLRERMREAAVAGRGRFDRHDYVIGQAELYTRILQSRDSFASGNIRHAENR